MFPSGYAGCALVLLRLCVTGSLALALYQNCHSRMIFFISLLPSAFVLIGLVTPAASSLVMVLEASSLRQEVASLTIVLHMLTTLSLLMLGPGAYSLDARLYGRRRVLIPPN